MDNFSYSYVICDVFTERLFGGNQLAVLPDARGISDEQMQRIAREFNFSETTFVLPVDSCRDDPAAEGITHRVRIFTPTRELAFAGHPNVGTAFVLERLEPDTKTGEGTFVFQEKAGRVVISLRTTDDGSLYAELQAPEKLSIGKQVPDSMIAAALTLPESAINSGRHAPQVASVGAPFVMVELTDQKSLQNIVLNHAAFLAIQDHGVDAFLFVYVRSDSGPIFCRMFAPLDGIPEDPATGSAAAALAGMLASFDSASGSLEWVFHQGDDMGRPSRLYARTVMQGDTVDKIYIGGTAVLFAEGTLHLKQTRPTIQ